MEIDVISSDLWKQVLPQVFVAFGVVLPLIIISGALDRTPATDGKLTIQWDALAALCLLAWLGYFVGLNIARRLTSTDWVVFFCLLASLFLAVRLSASNSGSGNFEKVKRIKLEGSALRVGLKNVLGACGVLARNTSRLFFRLPKKAARFFTAGFLTVGAAAYFFEATHTRIFLNIKKAPTEVVRFSYCYVNKNKTVSKDEPSPKPAAIHSDDAVGTSIDTLLVPGRILPFDHFTSSDSRFETVQVILPRGVINASEPSSCGLVLGAEYLDVESGKWIPKRFFEGSTFNTFSIKASSVFAFPSLNSEKNTESED
jgi:hypothetical protein